MPRRPTASRALVRRAEPVGRQAHASCLRRCPATARTVDRRRRAERGRVSTRTVSRRAIAGTPIRKRRLGTKLAPATWSRQTTTTSPLLVTTTIFTRDAASSGSRVATGFRSTARFHSVVPQWPRSLVSPTRFSAASRYRQPSSASDDGSAFRCDGGCGFDASCIRLRCTCARVNSGHGATVRPLKK